MAIQHQSKSLEFAMTSTSHVLAQKCMSNTYRLGPKKRFNSGLVYEILEEVVAKHCLGKKYVARKCSLQVQNIAEEILDQVKKLEFDRYRLVVVVQIFANKRQEIENEAKFLWDTSRDTFATYTLNGDSMYVTATCFGIYKD